MEIYNSLDDLVRLGKVGNKEIWQVILTRQAEEKLLSEQEVFSEMRQMYHAMKTADGAYDAKLKSASGMAGGDGEKMRIYNEKGGNTCGHFIGLAMEKAIKMGESNACMKRIVAAPTAGACGVIPAVFLAYEECFKPLEDELVKALITAAGVGAVIAQNACIAGAAGGCQAEIGSASAMAAAGLTYLMGGGSEEICNSVALGLKNMLGLTCDPVCGLVEVPCIKRNVSGAVNAITVSNMTMAGITSAIPADEVIDSMRRIGIDMPVCLKETGEGGLAITPSAHKYLKKIKNNDNTCQKS